MLTLQLCPYTTLHRNQGYHLKTNCLELRTEFPHNSPHSSSNTISIPPFKSWGKQRFVDSTKYLKCLLFWVVIAKELYDQGISEPVLLPLPEPPPQQLGSHRAGQSLNAKEKNIFLPDFASHGQLLMCRALHRASTGNGWRFSS